MKPLPPHPDEERLDISAGRAAVQGRADRLGRQAMARRGAAGLLAASLIAVGVVTAADRGGTSELAATGPSSTDPGPPADAQEEEVTTTTAAAETTTTAAAATTTAAPTPTTASPAPLAMAPSCPDSWERPPTSSSSQLDVSIVLPRTSGQGGENLDGDLVVHNPTGHPIRYDSHPGGRGSYLYQDTRWVGTWVGGVTADGPRPVDIQPGETHRLPISVSLIICNQHQDGWTPQPLPPGDYDFVATVYDFTAGMAAISPSVPVIVTS